MSQQRVKRVRSLGQKKFRKEQNAFIAEGFKVVEELLRSDWIVVELLVADEALLVNFPDAEIVSAKEMEQMSQQRTPSGVLAVASIPERSWNGHGQGRWLFLDRMNDPGNVGTLIRTAAWFGMDGVLLSEGSADLYNPKAVQSTMGALFHIPCYQDVHHATLSNSGLPVLAADMQGEDVFSFSFPEHGILVVGSESHGVSKDIEIKNRLTVKGAGLAESLNASVAAGILMATWSR